MQRIESRNTRTLANNANPPFATFAKFRDFRDKKMEIIEPHLSPTAKKIARKRYLRTDISGKVIETPGEMLWRVAKHMAKSEVNWNGGNGKVEETAAAFYHRMANFKFVCAGKAMFEAGNPGGTGQLSSCFVLPIEDNIQSIFKTLGDAAVVHKNNGGTGFNFSHIRPRGDKVKNVPGAASGPVDFLAAYSAALSKILQGAKRQGANIGILNADHPDIEDFIMLKDEDGTIKNFNISVGVTDEFMRSVRDDKIWSLVNPRTGETVRKLKARKLFQMIIVHAHQTGDPGLMFLDTFNRDNPTPQIGRIEATNPCGEIGLLPYESCNLTSICLQNHLKLIPNTEYRILNKRQKRLSSDHSEFSIQNSVFDIDWHDLEKSVRLGVRFLDDMIEVNTYAIPEIEQMVKNGNRRIGLGVMGFSHMLVKLKIPYNSIQAVELSEKLAKFIRQAAQDESIKLAQVRGSFPNWDRSIYFEKHPMRNCATTMIAPTGTTAMLADTTSGIEPIFSLVTKRKTFFEGDRKNRPTEELYMVDPVFETELAKITKNSENHEILKQVAEDGLNSVKGLPDWFYQVFVTTHDIAPDWHVKIQAAWQKHFDNSISKTINFPHSATPGDVEKAYMLAWKLGCKGITIYRDGSKKDQVLNLVALRPGSGPAAVCPDCGAAVIAENGCVTCHSCGWS